MKILFTIPTWNRAEQLSLTLIMIINSAKYANRNIEILVSDNHSTDATHSVLSEMTADYSFIEVIRPKSHISGMENYRFVLEQALIRTSESDYIWSFGDDDDISVDGVFNVFSVIEAENPYFISVGNIRLNPHSNKNYAGNVRDLAINFGFFLVFGFISQLIFSRKLIEDIIKNNLMSERFLHDSYSHGSSIIFSANDKRGVYIDSPISTYREVKNSEVETRKRWESERVYDGIFGFVESLKILTNGGILPKKLDRTFFRYWRWHFWDFLLYNASLSAMADKKNLNSKYWDSIYDLTGYLEDAELAKRICINVDLQRMIIASSSDNNFISLGLSKYEGLHVYRSLLGEK